MLGKIVIKAVLVLLTFTGGEQGAHNVAVVQGQTGSVKWGNVAMKETAKRYGEASIIDYRYEGSRKLRNGQLEERFKLWLREQGREFGVRVIIHVNAGSEQIGEVTFEETRN
jgi:hypothetical protein